MNLKKVIKNPYKIFSKVAKPIETKLEYTIGSNIWLKFLFFHVDIKFINHFEVSSTRAIATKYFIIIWIKVIFELWSFKKSKYVFNNVKIEKEIIAEIIPPIKSNKSNNVGSFSILSFVYIYHINIKLGTIHKVDIRILIFILYLFLLY